MTKIFFEMAVITALLNLENVQAFQFMISRPSLTALLSALPFYFRFSSYPVEGVLLDCFTSGFFIELITLDFNPVGGVIIPNGVLGAGISSILILSGNSLSVSFFGGLTAAFFYSSFVDYYLRNLRNSWNSSIEKEIIALKVCPGKWIFLSLFIEFAAGALFTVVYSLFFNKLAHYAFSGTYAAGAFNLALTGTVFAGLSSMFFRLKTQVGKHE